MIFESGNALAHDQDPDKVSVSYDGPLGFAEFAFILATQDGDTGTVYFEGEVDLGAVSFIDADNAGDTKLQASTEVFIYDVDITTLL